MTLSHRACKGLRAWCRGRVDNSVAAAENTRENSSCARDNGGCVLRACELEMLAGGGNGREGAIQFWDISFYSNLQVRITSLTSLNLSSPKHTLERKIVTSTANPLLVERDAAALHVLPSEGCILQR